MDGLLIIDKPEGITSHDVVSRVRRILRTKRVGHTGTLDPFATGVMVILVGTATRLARFIDKDEKEYEAVVRFGFETDTGDRTGMRNAERGMRNEDVADKIRFTDWEKVFERFRGDIMQTPPMYSAKKIEGRKLYELARAGIEVERKPVAVSIHRLELVTTEIQNPKSKIQNPDGGAVLSRLQHDDSGVSARENHPADEASAPLLPKEGSKRDSRLVLGEVAAASADAVVSSDDKDRPNAIRIRVACSAGTYVRTLAEDIGREVGVGAHLTELRRTRSGKFSVQDAVTLRELELMTEPASQLRPLTDAVAHLHAIKLSADRVEKTKNGLASRVDNDGFADGIAIRMLDAESNLIAIGSYTAQEKSVKPKIVLV